MRIKIAVAEDNPVTRKNYAKRFSFFEEIEIVTFAENGLDLLDKLSKLNPNSLPEIILMDFEMPKMNGVETVKIIREQYPSIEVVMLTVFREEADIFESILAGASGYLLKDASTEEIIEAIHNLKSGGVPLSKSIARKVLSLIRGKEKRTNKSEKFELTDREIQVLQAIVNDDTEYAIAKNLNISEHTVRSHVKNIYKKLQVHSRGAVVKVALKENLIKNNLN
ncbi:MAG: response regulator transcription factor [Melioribacteraceae bacterium]|nr:response regulator transcription factor [Melioribacteraceae bacterium]MCF8263406.1 response regulator transcription factor [Melioribacteraceae bacterium]MCF8430404.1 response regulator transcription factor [Melioribacteraceae bacterium]